MKEHKNQKIDPMEYDYLKASSVNDCTGLIPSGIKDSSEIENYEEIFPFLPVFEKYSVTDEEYLQGHKIFRPDDYTPEPE